MPLLLLVPALRLRPPAPGTKLPSDLDCRMVLPPAEEEVMQLLLSQVAGCAAVAAMQAQQLVKPFCAEWM